MGIFRTKCFTTQYPTDDSDQAMEINVNTEDGDGSAEEDESGETEESSLVVDADEIREWNANYAILEKNMKRFMKMALDLTKKLIEEKKGGVKSTAASYKRYKSRGIHDAIGQREVKRMKDSLRMQNADLCKLAAMAAELEWGFFSLSTPHLWSKCV